MPSVLRPWKRAGEIARRTGPERNRYVDFLRAASIVVVVVGHWLMATPTVRTGVGFTLSDMLRVAPWSRWLTWVFQVMPLFFVVGGYANAASWESARRNGKTYARWLSGRLQRLVRPLVPFLLAWSALAFAARWIGLGRAVVGAGSRAAFVPTWFLAVYVLVVVLAPAMHGLWRRFGMASFWGLVVGAAAVDMAARGFGVVPAGWANFVFVWLAIHQLGFAWRDGALSEPRLAVSFALAGLAGLIVLVGTAGYPVSMVTVPGPVAANATPPTLALLALGVTHTGIVVSLEAPARRLLERSALWTATVLVNGIIMTVYLWHATVMVILVGVAELPGGVGLHFVPNTPTWWYSRVPWILVLLVGLSFFVAVFGAVELQPAPPAAPPRAWRSVAGALAVCVGLVALAQTGIGADNAAGFRLVPVLLTLGGAALVAATRIPGAVSALFAGSSRRRG